MSEWKRLYHVNTSVNDFRQKILSNYNRYNFILFYFASRVSFLNLNRTIKSYLLFYALFLIAERLKVRLLCIFLNKQKKPLLISSSTSQHIDESVSEWERKKKFRKWNEYHYRFNAGWGVFFTSYYIFLHIVVCYFRACSRFVSRLVLSARSRGAAECQCSNSGSQCCCLLPICTVNKMRIIDL